MPYNYNLFLSSPHTHYDAKGAAKANELEPVFLGIRLTFCQTITWSVNGSPDDCQYTSRCRNLRVKAPCFANLDSGVHYIRSVLESFKLPLPGGQDKVDELARRIVEPIRRILERIPSEGLVWVLFMARIEMQADLDISAADVSFELATEDYDGDEGECCPVCQEEFKQGMELKRTPCGHWFHESCIMLWLETSGECPLCRTDVPSKVFVEGTVFPFD